MTDTSAKGSGLRTWFLLRRRLNLRRDSERAEFGKELGWVEAVAGASPEFRGELEEAVARPMRQDPEEVSVKVVVAIFRSIFGG